MCGIVPRQLLPGGGLAVDVWTGRIRFNVGRGRRPAEPVASPVAARAAVGVRAVRA
jgi:hypothetical protein